MAGLVDEIPIQVRIADFSKEDQSYKKVTKIFLVGIFLLLAVGLTLFFVTNIPSILLVMIPIAVILWALTNQMSKRMGFGIHPILMDSDSIMTKGAVVRGMASTKNRLRYEEIASIEVLKESLNGNLPDIRQRKMMILRTARGEEVVFKAWDGQFIDQAAEKIRSYSGSRTPLSSITSEVLPQKLKNSIDNRWELIAIFFFVLLTLYMAWLEIERIQSWYVSESSRSIQGAIVFLFISSFFGILTIRFAIELNTFYYKEIEITDDHFSFTRKFLSNRIIAWGDIRGIQYPEPSPPEKDHGHSLVLSKGKPIRVDREVAFALIKGYKQKMGVEPARFIDYRDNYRTLQD